MAATAGLAMFGTDCVNCDSDADVDVEVLNTGTGETVRDVFACESCASEIDVGANYYVRMDDI